MFAYNVWALPSVCATTQSAPHLPRSAQSGPPPIVARMLFDPALSVVPRLTIGTPAASSSLASRCHSDAGGPPVMTASGRASTTCFQALEISSGVAPVLIDLTVQPTLSAASLMYLPIKAQPGR